MLGAAIPEQRHESGWVEGVAIWVAIAVVVLVGAWVWGGAWVWCGFCGCVVMVRCWDKRDCAGWGLVVWVVVGGATGVAGWRMGVR